MTSTISYEKRRGEIETYFDRTAVDAWKRLTSDAPVGRIRATVRAGRDHMRATLLSWLPQDLRGLRLLDAGCGTGALATAAAHRGAEVVAIDLSPTLVGLARERYSLEARTAPSNGGDITFLSGDMLDRSLGRFDYVVAMDSIIHYEAPDLIRVLEGLAARADRGVVFTFAPRTRMLGFMHAVGRFFPRGDRAPSIAPIAVDTVRQSIQKQPGLAGWSEGRSERVARAFYISQAFEITRTSAEPAVRARGQS